VGAADSVRRVTVAVRAGRNAQTGEGASHTDRARRARGFQAPLHSHAPLRVSDEAQALPRPPGAIQANHNRGNWAHLVMGCSFVPEASSWRSSGSSLSTVCRCVPLHCSSPPAPVDPNPPVQEDAARFYAAEVLTALEYLHALGFIYRGEAAPCAVARQPDRAAARLEAREHPRPRHWSRHLTDFGVLDAMSVPRSARLDPGCAGGCSDLAAGDVHLNRVAATFKSHTGPRFRRKVRATAACCGTTAKCHCGVVVLWPGYRNWPSPSCGGTPLRRARNPLWVPVRCPRGGDGGCAPRCHGCAAEYMAPEVLEQDGYDQRVDWWCVPASASAAAPSVSLASGLIVALRPRQGVWHPCIRNALRSASFPGAHMASSCVASRPGGFAALALLVASFLWLGPPREATGTPHST